jgi:hypothetical protein
MGILNCPPSVCSWPVWPRWGYSSGLFASTRPDHRTLKLPFDSFVRRPGYRIHLAKKSDILIVLIGGGTKRASNVTSTEPKDC